jgi:hypothetical protein
MRRKTLDGIWTQWEKAFGDRRQEIVFIGQGLDQSALTEMLEAALLTDIAFEHGAAGLGPSTRSFSVSEKLTR